MGPWRSETYEEWQSDRRQRLDDGSEGGLGVLTDFSLSLIREEEGKELHHFPLQILRQEEAVVERHQPTKVEENQWKEEGRCCRYE